MWLQVLLRYALDSQVCVFEFKVTVHVGTDQNIEIEIFVENKYTLNELLVKTFFFQYV